MNQIPYPSPQQKRWQEVGLGLFCHFGINTFNNKEWSAGDLDPATFDPQKFDARQWAKFAHQAGFRYLVFTAKHHDGFCLWPTSTTEYSVKSSPCRIDIVGEVAQACREVGIHFGLYLSPWDRNAACYDDKESYDRFYIQQLTELCTNYGELFEIWLDGAGSEGRVYNWDAIMQVIDTHQPNAVIFNMGRPTIRWIGNENGLAKDPCYYAASQTSVSAFTEAEDSLGEDKIYIPPECDVAVRRNWFWQDDDLETLKTKEHLLGIWYRSIGFGTNLLLNLGPNRDGLLDEYDTARVLEVTREIERRFAHPFAAMITPTPTGCDLEFDTGPDREIIFDHLVLRENYSKGQLINGYRVLDENGAEITQGHTIGHQKWHAFAKNSARKLRVEWGEDCLPNARLCGAEIYLTGHETLPELGAPIDYSDPWKVKLDA